MFSLTRLRLPIALIVGGAFVALRNGIVRQTDANRRDFFSLNTHALNKASIFIVSA